MSRAARSARIRITVGSASDSSASRQRSASPVTSARPCAATASASALAVAAASTVVPHTPASAIRTDSSGSQRSRQVSRKVPVLPREAAGSPQATPSNRSRCSSLLRPASVSLRRSSSSSRSAASGFSRSRRWIRARSRCSGTAGAVAGTSPSTSPTTSRSCTSASGTSEPSHITARTASVVSPSPGSGRPRSAASVPASRTASMTCADDTIRSSSRSSPATLVIHRSTGRSGAPNRCPYQPGESMPAPYPLTRDSLRLVQGTQVMSVLTLGSPFSRARSAATVAFRRSAGTCQAPHTTATPSSNSRRAARTWSRMYASRTGSRSCPPLPYVSRSAVMASSSAVNGASASPSPTPRCSTTSSHHRSGSSYPAAPASTPSGSTRASAPGPASPEPGTGPSPSSAPSFLHASVWAAGRSMKRAGTPCSSAQRIATHSGENPASGQKAERPGSSTAWASRATGGRMSSSAASGISGSASGGPSISTIPGRTSSSAARTARADPGPWCRTPSRCDPAGDALPSVRSTPVTGSPSPPGPTGVLGPARTPVRPGPAGLCTRGRCSPALSAPHRGVHALTSRQAR
ncbi:hypothetical protein SGRIM128S_09354 [Streptomyces griseomycini]